MVTPAYEQKQPIKLEEPPQEITVITPINSRNVEKVAQKIPLLLATWNKMGERKLLETACNLFAVDEDIVKQAVQKLLSEGKISCEDGVYKIVK